MCGQCAGSERRAAKREAAERLGEIERRVLDSVWYPWVMTALSLVVIGVALALIEAIKL